MFDFLSDRARQRLERLGATVSPELRGSEGELAERLRAQGQPLWASVAEVQRSVGGLTWSEGEDWTVIISPCQHAGKPLSFAGREWVAVGGFWGVYYVDEAGVMLENDELDSLCIMANSVVSWLEERALEEEASGRFGTGPRSVKGLYGEAFAHALSLSAEPRASGPARRWWAGRAFVEEAFEPEEHLVRRYVWRTYFWADDDDCAQLEGLAAGTSSRTR
jgi:hypothetical protein